MYLLPFWLVIALTSCNSASEKGDTTDTVQALSADDTFRVLAFSAQSMERAKPEGTLGNFVSDIVLVESRKLFPSVDFCVLNNNVLQSDLPKGNITVNQIHNLVPAEQKLIALNMNEAALKKLADFIIGKGGLPVAGMQLLVSPDSSYTFTINGKSLQQGPFWLVTTQELLDDTEVNTFLTGPEEKIELNYFLKDALICHLQNKGQQNDTKKAVLDGRIKFN